MKTKWIIAAIPVVLTFVSSMIPEARAGALPLCDRYGNKCIVPGGDCSRLIPPVHACYQSDLKLIHIEDDDLDDQDLGPQLPTSEVSASDPLSSS